LLAHVVSQEEGGLGQLDAVAVFAEEVELCVLLLPIGLIVVEELLVLEQIANFGEELGHELAVDLRDESLDEDLAGFVEDKIAVVLHLLVDVVDDVGVELVELAELSEAPLDDEFEADQQIVRLVGGGERHEAVDESFEETCVGLHVLEERLCLVSNDIGNRVDFKDLLDGLDEIERSLLEVDRQRNAFTGLVEVIGFEEVPNDIEDFIIFGETQGELLGGFPLGNGVVPIVFDVADEGVEDLRELEIGVDSSFYDFVEVIALLWGLLQLLVLLLEGQGNDIGTDLL
jgi:hypothetical protein